MKSVMQFGKVVWTLLAVTGMCFVFSGCGGDEAGKKETPSTEQAEPDKAKSDHPKGDHPKQEPPGSGERNECVSLTPRSIKLEQTGGVC